MVQNSRGQVLQAQAHHCRVAMSIFVASFSFQFRARRYLTSVASVMKARSSMELCAHGQNHHATEGRGKVKRYRAYGICRVHCALSSSIALPLGQKVIRLNLTNPPRHRPSGGLLTETSLLMNWKSACNGGKRPHPRPKRCAPLHAEGLRPADHRPSAAPQQSGSSATAQAVEPASKTHEVLRCGETIRTVRVVSRGARC